MITHVRFFFDTSKHRDNHNSRKTPPDACSGILGGRVLRQDKNQVLDSNTWFRSIKLCDHVTLVKLRIFTESCSIFFNSRKNIKHCYVRVTAKTERSDAFYANMWSALLSLSTQRHSHMLPSYTSISSVQFTSRVIYWGSVCWIHCYFLEIKYVSNMGLLSGSSDSERESKQVRWSLYCWTDKNTSFLKEEILNFVVDWKYFIFSFLSLIGVLGMVDDSKQTNKQQNLKKNSAM